MIELILVRGVIVSPWEDLFLQLLWWADSRCPAVAEPERAMAEETEIESK